MKARLMIAAAIALVGSAAFAQESGDSKFVVVGQSQPAMYKIVYSNPGASRAKLNIYKGTGEKVYSEALSVDGFVRSVNMASMTYGEYTFELSDNKGTYSKKINYVRQTKPAAIHVSKIAKESNKYLLSVSNDAATEINVTILDGNEKVVHTQSLAVNGSVGLVYDLASINGKPTFEVSDSNGARRTIRY